MLVHMMYHFHLQDRRKETRRTGQRREETEEREEEWEGEEKPGRIVHTGHLGTPALKMSGLHSEFEDSLGYMRPCELQRERKEGTGQERKGKGGGN